MKETCLACDKPVNAAAARCPHCGAKLRDADIKSAKVSSDEAAAFLAISDRHGPPPDQTGGPIASLLLPHPATRGGRRALELALTACGLPVVMVGVLALALAPKTYRRLTVAGPLGVLALISVFGGWLFYSALSIAGISGATRLALTIGSAGALWLRHAVQRAAMSEGARRRSAALTERTPNAAPALARAIAQPERAPVPARGEGTGVESAPPSQPAPSSAAKAKEQSAEQSADPRGEPSILR